MIIPKDCCLCDVCNDQLTDEKFIALQDCLWYKGWLYCLKCQEKYQPQKDLILIRKITKGEDISNTELAYPIIFEEWGGGENGAERND